MSTGFDQLVDQLKIRMLARKDQEQIIGKLEETILQATIGSITERLSARGRGSCRSDTDVHCNASAGARFGRRAGAKRRSREA